MYIRLVTGLGGIIGMRDIPGISRTLQPPRVHYFAQVTMTLLRIHECAASGRLSLRNESHFGIAHLYFREALLVHVIGDKHGGSSVLREVMTWSQARVRFDWDAAIGAHQCVSCQEAELFSHWLSMLETQSVSYGVPATMVVGLEERLAGYLMHRSTTLPVVTSPMLSQRTMLTRSSADWPPLDMQIATPVELVTPRPGVDMHLPVTPQPAITQETDALSSSRQATGVMQAVGRVASGITRKIARIKLPSH